MALTFEVEMSDGVSKSAVSASQQIGVLTKQMAALQTQMIKANAAGNDKAFSKQASEYQKIGAQVKLLGGKKSDIDALNKSTEKLGGAAKGAADGGMAKLGLNSQMVAKGALAVKVAVMAAVAAVVAFAAAAIYAGMKLSVMAGEAKRAFESTIRGLQLGKTGGDAVLASVKHLTDALPMAKEEVQGLAREFMAAGIRDAPNLTRAIKAVAAATAFMGEGGASKVKGLIVSLKDAAPWALSTAVNVRSLNIELEGTGLFAEDIAQAFDKTGAQLDEALRMGTVRANQLGDAIQNAMIKKGAGAIQTANMKIDTLLMKAKQRLTAIFDGVVDTPGYKAFVEAIYGIMALFDQASGAAGQSKDKITSMFGSIFGVAAKTLTFIAITVLKVATAFLRLYIALHPTIHNVLELTRGLATFIGWCAVAWGWIMTMIVANQDFLTGLEIITLTLAIFAAMVTAAFFLPFIIGAAVIYAVIAALVWLTGYIINNTMDVLEGLGIALAALTFPIWAIPAALVGVVYAFIRFHGAIVAVVEKVWQWFTGWAEKGADAAYALAEGLTDGLKKGAKWVIDAAKGLGSSAMGAIKGILKMSSPSKVMVDVGLNMGKGMEQGLEKSGDNVKAAAKGMATSGVEGSLGGGKKGESGLTIRVEKGAIVINGNGDKGLLELTEEALADLLERIALSQGLGST